VHIDVADGKFAPHKLLDPAQVYLPELITTDVHVMYEEPQSQLMTLMSLQPNVVIVHAEAKGDLVALMADLQKVQIKAGIALLPDTHPHDVAPLIIAADHVLIFAGQLGYQGGAADMSQLAKIAEVKAINPRAEIAWDGGVTVNNVRALVESGVDVLNVGGFIHNDANPAEAYQRLMKAIEP
jgi:ribulose-phosphate 3-epimerase